MVLPLAGEGVGPAAGAIVLAASAARALDDSYQSFLQLVAHHTAQVINSASAYQVRRRKADELAEIDRAKTAFFAHVSHEFRTPLALIMGPLAELRARLAGRAMCSTAFCVILDPATGRFTYSSAGHPPGILAHPDGRAELLEEGRSLSLAIEPGRRRSDAEGWLRAGAVLLLYTDGLVERRRRPPTAGIAAVAAALRDGHGLPVQDLASQVMAALAPSGGYEDDVALVLYRHPATDVPRAAASRLGHLLGLIRP